MKLRNKKIVPMRNNRHFQEINFINLQPARNIQDLNLEFQLYKQHLQITQAENPIDLTSESQAFQIIKVRFRDYNQMKDLII